MVISKNGAICTKLINDYSKKNPEVSASIEKLNTEFEGILSKVIAQSPATILASDSNSVSLARVTENGIGNLMTDAFRKRMKSDIAIVNGGNVRANIPKGNVTYRNLLEISPFENMIVMARVKGATLLDALEHAYRMVKSDVNGNQVISKELETGSFLQTSGLKIVVDGSVETSIERDSAGNFKNVSGKRKVVDVQVEKNGKFVPLDTAAEYLVASVDYLLQNAGDGYSMFSDSNIVDDAGLTLVEIVADYLQGELKGKIPERYTKPEGRLTVK
jgi:2',3'-cyclic-nucleotide 2'-phosphodiesterase (5'-nucleotidase family)